MSAFQNTVSGVKSFVTSNRGRIINGMAIGAGVIGGTLISVALIPTADKVIIEDPLGTSDIDSDSVDAVEAPIVPDSDN